MSSCANQESAPHVHCTTTVAVLDLIPPIDKTKGTAIPGVTPAGTWTFTWYSPPVPGASPEKSTFAGAPPIVTLGLVVVWESVVLEAAAPLAGGFVTGPSPVQ